MKHGSNSIQDAAKPQGRFGYRWDYPFCLKVIASVELWDGYVIRDNMRSSLPWSNSSGGEVLNGGTPHILRE